MREGKHGTGKVSPRHKAGSEATGFQNNTFPPGSLWLIPN